MKKCTVLISVIMLLGFIVGCSEKTETFDDVNIVFEVVDTESNNESKADVIKITNETGFDLDNLLLKVSYPLDQSNTNNNTEREIVEFIDKFKLKLNETKTFTISPLKGNMGVNELEIDFMGSVIEGNNKIPFEIGSTLSALAAVP